VKKIIFILLILSFFAGTAAAKDTELPDFLVIRLNVGGIAAAVTAEGEMDPAQIYRGMNFSTQLFLNLLGLHLGGEGILEYDTIFNVSQTVALVEIGFGPNFWIAAGYTIPFTQPYVDLGASTRNFIYYDGGTTHLIPNTYGLGFNIPFVDLGFAEIGLTSMFSFTAGQLEGAADPTIDFLNILDFFVDWAVRILGGLKGYVSVSMKFGI
jgi:hypothetical protein